MRCHRGDVLITTPPTELVMPLRAGTPLVAALEEHRANAPCSRRCGGFWGGMISPTGWRAIAHGHSRDILGTHVSTGTGKTLAAFWWPEWRVAGYGLSR